MKFFILFLLLSASVFAEPAAEGCGDCEPLAEVSITNEGLEKLISISLDENLKTLDQEVAKRSNFRNLTLDRSNCKTQTLAQAWSNREKEDNCFGLPEFQPDSISMNKDTLLRPYKAEVSNIKLNKVDLQLAAPVKCKEFICDFEIKSNNIDVSADMQVQYTDKKEDFVPKTQISIKSTDKADIRFSGQVLINPTTGHINDLVFLNEKKSKISLTPGSLQMGVNFKKEFASKEDEIRMRAQNFHRYVKYGKIDAQYIEQQYTYTRLGLISDLEESLRESRRREGKTDLRPQELRSLAEKEIDKEIIASWGSVAKFKEHLRSIKWPSPNDPQGTYDFIQNPPAGLGVLSEIKQQMFVADIAAIGENSGFKNGSAFYYTLVATDLANQVANSGFLTEDLLEPLIEKEVLPMVQKEVNTELRNLREYWNQIAKIPNLNAQNLKILADMEDKLKNSKSDEERKQLQEKINALKKKMEADWISIDTEVAIDRNTRNNKLLKAQISKSNPSCKDVPKKFSDDEDTDFDVRTGFGVNTLQEYFNRMAQNKNLDLCLDSEDAINCRGGTKVSLKTPPKIGCENGEFTFEIDAEAAEKFFIFDVQADVGAKLKAKIQNCSGSPCIQISDSKGRFKNVLLNTFFGNMVDRGLSSAVAKTNSLPVSVPHVNLKKHQTDPRTCNTKLDWDFKPPPQRKP